MCKGEWRRFKWFFFFRVKHQVALSTWKNKHADMSILGDKYVWKYMQSKTEIYWQKWESK